MTRTLLFLAIATATTASAVEVPAAGSSSAAIERCLVAADRAIRVTYPSLVEVTATSIGTDWVYTSKFRSGPHGGWFHEERHRAIVSCSGDAAPSVLVVRERRRINAGRLERGWKSRLDSGARRDLEAAIQGELSSAAHDTRLPEPVSRPLSGSPARLSGLASGIGYFRLTLEDVAVPPLRSDGTHWDFDPEAAPGTPSTLPDPMGGIAYLDGRWSLKLRDDAVDPDWQWEANLPFQGADVDPIEVVLLDWDPPDQDDVIGSCMFTLGQILDAGGKVSSPCGMAAVTLSASWVRPLGPKPLSEPRDPSILSPSRAPGPERDPRLFGGRRGTVSR